MNAPATSKPLPKADILIVDDQPNNLRLLSQMLTQQGYKVRKATSGELALQAVAAVNPDLILLDIMMPGMSGLKVCHLLKAEAATCKIPIIFLSAQDATEVKVKAFQIGGSDYITKPFRQEEVLVRVSHQVKLRQQQQQLQIQNLSLQISEARYRELFEQMNEAVWQTTPEGQYLSINPAHARMLGYESPAAVIEQIQDIAHQLYVEPEHRQVFQEQLATHGSVRNLELQFRRRDGSIGWGLESARAVHDAQGNLLYYEGITADITQRKQAEAQLQMALREKTALLQEVYHRVKNNLQIVCSLLRLQMKRISDPELQAILEDSHSRVMAMSLVHQSLYQSDNFAQVDLGKYICTLCTQLFGSFGIPDHQIHLNLSAEVEAAVPLDKAVPCGLILNELITNAIKHGFAGGQHSGELQVLLHASQPGLLTLEVSNNGLPLPENFSSESYKSMGLKLVQLLCDQLNGTISVQPGATTTFRVTFTTR